LGSTLLLWGGKHSRLPNISDLFCTTAYLSHAWRVADSIFIGLYCPLELQSSAIWLATMRSSLTYQISFVLLCIYHIFHRFLLYFCVSITYFIRLNCPFGLQYCAIGLHQFDRFPKSLGPLFITGPIRAGFFCKRAPFLVAAPFNGAATIGKLLQISDLVVLLCIYHIFLLKGILVFFRHA